MQVRYTRVVRATRDDRELIRRHLVPPVLQASLASTLRSTLLPVTRRGVLLPILNSQNGLDSHLISSPPPSRPLLRASWQDAWWLTLREVNASAIN
jgi:hypothetical protein